MGQGGSTLQTSSRWYFKIRVSCGLGLGEIGFTLKWFLGKNQGRGLIYLIYLKIPYYLSPFGEVQRHLPSAFPAYHVLSFRSPISSPFP